MAAHSSTLAWKIPWREEPGRLQSMASWRVGHDWATSLSLFTFMHWRRKWQFTPLFLPGETQGRVAWWAAIYGVAQSETRLKRLSSSSSKHYYGYILWMSHDFFHYHQIWIFSNFLMWPNNYIYTSNAKFLNWYFLWSPFVINFTCI